MVDIDRNKHQTQGYTNTSRISEQTGKEQASAQTTEGKLASGVAITEGGVDPSIDNKLKSAYETLDPAINFEDSPFEDIHIQPQSSETPENKAVTDCVYSSGVFFDEEIRDTQESLKPEDFTDWHDDELLTLDAEGNIGFSSDKKTEDLEEKQVQEQNPSKQFIKELQALRIKAKHDRKISKESLNVIAKGVQEIGMTKSGIKEAFDGLEKTKKRRLYRFLAKAGSKLKKEGRIETAKKIFEQLSEIKFTLKDVRSSFSILSKTLRIQKKIQKAVKKPFAHLIKNARSQMKQDVTLDAVKFSKKDHADLNSSITITKEGKIFEHTKEYIGKGGFKTVKGLEEVGGIKKAVIGKLTKSGIDIEKTRKFGKIFENQEGLLTGTYVSWRSKDIETTESVLKEGFISGRMNTDMEKIVQNKDSRLPENIKKKAMQTLAKGLYAMHKKNYVHRDIKPENCFVNWKPGSESIEAKLGDFDTVCDKNSFKELKEKFNKELEGMADEAQLLGSVSGQVNSSGTAHYLPPECTRGEVQVKNSKEFLATLKKRDVYSLGLTFYAMEFPENMVQGKMNEETNSYPPWLVKNDAIDNNGNADMGKIIENIGRLDQASFEEAFPEPNVNENPRQHTIWTMIHPNPDMRPSMKDVAKQLYRT